MAVPVVDEAKCTGCGQCANDLCQFGVFKIANGKATVAEPDECIGCRTCEMCPAGAIEVEG